MDKVEKFRLMASVALDKFRVAAVIAQGTEWLEIAANWNS